MVNSSYLRYFEESQYSYSCRHKFGKKSTFSVYLYSKNWGYYTYGISNDGSNRTR